MSRVQIIEVVREAIQGKSGVYYCHGDDGNSYYVKGHNVGRLDQSKEWICGNLAKAFGLPIAEFCLVEIDEYFCDYLPSHLAKIGHGICFASREVRKPLWLEPNSIGKVPLSDQRDTLVFDWWIKNDDRTRGNPNLLWDQVNNRLKIIDHNLAFDRQLDRATFTHSIFKVIWLSEISQKYRLQSGF